MGMTTRTGRTNGDSQGNPGLLARMGAAQQGLQMPMPGQSPLPGGGAPGSPMAPERNQAMSMQMAQGMPPPTQAASPAMLAARRMAAQQGAQPASQGAFGPGLDGAQGPPMGGPSKPPPWNMNGLRRYNGG